MKFGSKKAILGAIFFFFGGGGVEGFGPCLGIRHPTHPHLGEISFFGCLPLGEPLSIGFIANMGDT